MPLPALEGFLQCCHYELVKTGTGTNRRNVRTRCKNKAALNELRCPIHAGMGMLHKQDVQHLLVSEEEKRAERPYPLMFDVQITLSTPTESTTKNRHPMSMAPPDILHAKDFEITKMLIAKLQKTQIGYQNH